MTLEVERHGRDITLRATPANAQTLKVGGQPVDTGKTPEGMLGVELSELTVRSSWYGAIPSSFAKIGSAIAADVHAMVHVFSPGEFSSLFHQVASSRGGQQQDESADEARVDRRRGAHGGPERPVGHRRRCSRF